MIVLDARVLIAYLDSDDSHHAAAEALLAEAVDDDIAANPLTLAEVLVAPARQGRGSRPDRPSRTRSERAAISG